MYHKLLIKYFIYKSAYIHTLDKNAGRRIRKWVGQEFGMFFYMVYLQKDSWNWHLYAFQGKVRKVGMQELGKNSKGKEPEMGQSFGVISTFKKEYPRAYDI